MNTSAERIVDQVIADLVEVEPRFCEWWRGMPADRQDRIRSYLAIMTPRWPVLLTLHAATQAYLGVLRDAAPELAAAQRLAGLHDQVGTALHEHEMGTPAAIGATLRDLLGGGD